MNTQQVETSKFLSLILRHKPESIGLRLDEQGWAEIETLLNCANRAGKRLTYEMLIEAVETNDKQRFAISGDGQRIRANQGHSVQVDLALVPLEPPEILYHGTAVRFLESILREGLVPGKRHHVHLSADIQTARKVGQRHGKPAVLEISAGKMYGAGILFYQSENGVWLTDNVAPEYFRQLEAD